MSFYTQGSSQGTPMASRWRSWAAGCLLAVGLLQSFGHLTGLKAVKGLGAALACSPLPLVFTEVRGVETFASAFTLEYRNGDDTLRTLPIGPREYGRLGGPYNWRNVYGAAISYGPILPEPLWKAVLHQGFCYDGPLTRALGTGTVRSASILVRTRTAGRSDAWRLGVECK